MVESTPPALALAATGIGVAILPAAAPIADPAAAAFYVLLKARLAPSGRSRAVAGSRPAG